MYESPMYMIKKNKKGSFFYGDKRAKMKMTVVEEQINQEDLKAEESEEDEKKNSKENSKEDKSHSLKNNKNKNSSIGTSNKDEDKVMNFSFGKQRIGSKKKDETFSQENDIYDNSPSRNNQSKNKSRYSKTYDSPSRSNEKSDNKIDSEYSTPNGDMREIDEENYKSPKNPESVKPHKKNKKYYDSEEESEESEEDEENDNVYNYNNRDKDINTVSEVEENEFYEGNTQYMSKNFGNYDYGDSVSEKESMEDFPNMMNIFKEDPNKEKKEKEEQKRILAK